MRRFRFRLNRLLELRRYRETEWELKLASITGRCLLIRQKIQENGQDIVHTIRSRQVNVGLLDLNMLFAAELYISRMDQEIGSLGEELEIREKEREEIKNQYLEVSRDRKVLDKLREKREAGYYREQKKEEFKIADDITTGRAARENVTGGR
jgi:flagellar FliJ protein